MNLKFTHSRLLVSKFKECFKFYRDVLGFAVIWGEETGRYAEFNTGETSLALYKKGLMAGVVGKQTLASSGNFQDSNALIFATGNVDETYKKLEQNGVRFINPPKDYAVWGIRAAHFRDPDGNLIEINSPLK